MINIKNNHINEIGALILFATYYYVFSIDTNNESYMDSKYWLGLKKETIRTLVPIQILSAIGFIVWFISVRNNPPKKGLLSYKFLNNPMYEVLVLLLVIGAIMWPLTLLQKGILTNMHIDMDYETLLSELPSNVEPAYDGMKLTSSRNVVKE